MNKPIILVLLFVLGTCFAIVPILADIPSPLAQYKDGVPADQTECREGRVLLKQVHNDKPACVFSESVDELLQRGFVIVERQTAQEQNEDDMKPQVTRGPAQIPLLDMVYGGNPSIWTELSHADLIAKKQSNEVESAYSASSETTDTFDDTLLESWIPEYLPDGYKIGYTLFSTFEYNGQTKSAVRMQIVPSSFNYTSTTVERDVWEGGGIFYSTTHKFGNIENYASMEGMQIWANDGWVIVDQTNEYFGLISPNNDTEGFAVRATFPDYKIRITSYSLNEAEGVKILNSIRGTIFPE